MKFIFENCNTLEEIAKGYFLLKENIDLLENYEKGKSMKINSGFDVYTITKNNASIKINRKTI